MRRRELSFRNRLRHHKAMSRNLKVTIPDRIDDLCRRLGVFGRAFRTRCGRRVGEDEVSFAATAGGACFGSGVNPKSTLVACPELASPALSSVEPATPKTAAGFVVGEKSLLNCCETSVTSAVFGCGSRTATITAANTTEPKSPVATQVVLRFNLPIALSALVRATAG
jgi:hypothetical protein